MHEATQTSKSKEMDRYSSAYLNDLIQYGPLYLNKAELHEQVQKLLRTYYRFLAVNYFLGFRDKAFWDYHRGRLTELGYPFSRLSLLKAGISTIIKNTLNPGQSLRKLRDRVFPKSSKPAVPDPPPNTSELKEDAQVPQLARGTRS